VIVLTEWLVGRRRLLQAARHPDPDPVINGEGAGIAIRKGETELREMFNEAIAAIRANGTYKEINDKYFDVDVYGE
jgi:polar amino acid transport system substrate-binding protein